MKSTNTKDFLCLEGSSFHRGFIHGKVFKEQILELINLWKIAIKRSYKTSSEDFIGHFLNQVNYIDYIKKYTPNLLEEVNGIAKGSGMDFQDIFAFQLLDEFLVNLEEINSEHCSSIGVNKIDGKEIYIAQNWDILGLLKGFQIILYIKHQQSNLESLIFTYPGFLAAFGINNQGIGICVNSLSQLNFSKKGLPVAFIIRGILRKSNQEDAIKFLHEIKHCSPQNYLIGGPEKIYDFECSANKITPLIIKKDSPVIYHTNHPLVNDDFIMNKQKKLKDDNSYTRFTALEKRLDVPRENLTISFLKSILSSHDSEEYPICMNYKNDASLFTFGSTVMVLSEHPEFHITMGPPDVNPYRIYKFDR